MKSIISKTIQNFCNICYQLSILRINISKLYYIFQETQLEVKGILSRVYIQFNHKLLISRIISSVLFFSQNANFSTVKKSFILYNIFINFSLWKMQSKRKCWIKNVYLQNEIFSAAAATTEAPQIGERHDVDDCESAAPDASDVPGPKELERIVVAVDGDVPEPIDGDVRLDAGVQISFHVTPSRMLVPFKQSAR